MFFIDVAWQACVVGGFDDVYMSSERRHVTCSRLAVPDIMGGIDKSVLPRTQLTACIQWVLILIVALICIVWGWL